jgi:hypothetical protein
VERIKDLGAMVRRVPAKAELPDLIGRIARLWAVLHEADSALALELAEKLPTMTIHREQ